MLRDGEFLQEAPVQIGAHYVPKFFDRNPTKEECFIQQILLKSAHEKKQNFLRKILFI